MKVGSPLRVPCYAITVRVAVILAGALCAACGATPPQTAERALYLDLEKIVELQESTDWVVDRLEVEDVSPAVMRSACQVEAEPRARLLGWLDRRIVEEGGPAEEAWRREGRDLDAIGHILRLERIRLVLAHAHDHAEQDCPFWLEPDPHFAGLQIDESRFVLIADSLGSGALFVRSEAGTTDTRLGGSGAVRVMPGFGIAPRVMLALGIEAGGSGDLAEDEDTGTRQLAAVFTAGIPLLLRIQDGSRLVDVELAAVTTWRGDGPDLPPGVRVSVGYGLSTLRVAGFMPTGVLWAGYEIHPARDGNPVEHAIRIGTKVGVDWDP